MRWVLAIALVAAAPPARAGWEATFGIGYGESVALDRAAPRRAHVPVGRGRIHHRFAGGLAAGADLAFPVMPGVPYGQLGAGLSAGKTWALGAPRVVEEAIEVGWELRAGLGGGWTHVQSDVSEGYLALGGDAVSFHGPYGALDGAVLWSLRSQRSRLAVSIGLGVTAGATRASYRIPERGPGWRLGADGTLTTALRW